MSEGFPPSKPKRIFWMLLLAIPLPTGLVFLLAINSILNEYQSEIDQERNHLKFLAALRARELDTLPALVTNILNQKQPILHLPMAPPPPLPGERPLMKSFFVLNSDNQPVLPRLPYMVTSASEDVAPPFLLRLNSLEAFTPPEEESIPLVAPKQVDLWNDELQEAEDLAEKGEIRRAMLQLRGLASRTGNCFFMFWVKYRWAQLAETLDSPPVAEIESTYVEITRSSFRELNPSHPLRLYAAFYLARNRWKKTNDFTHLFQFLKILYTDPSWTGCNRSGYQAALGTLEALLTRPGAPPLPEELNSLRKDINRKTFLVEEILPNLPDPGKDVTFIQTTLADGESVFLAYRRVHATYSDSEFTEGGILDLTSPEAPLAREIALRGPGNVVFAVVDSHGTVLSGQCPSTHNPLLEEVEGGPGNLFRVRAFHSDPNTFLADLNRNRFLLLTFITLVALAGVAVGYLAFRSLGRELELTRLKTEFIAGVSHELRTPLTTIQMFGEMLSLGRYKDREQTERYYTAINEEAARLKHLIDDLLDFGRMEAGRAVLSVSPVDPHAVVRSALQAFARTPEGEDRDVTFESNCSGPLEVVLDSNAVERALLNLLMNAAKYSKPDTPVRVTLSVADAMLEFQVIDLGSGIPRKYHRRIFEKFFRVPDLRIPDVGGTGLGLALVHQIARAHNGSVAVSSTPGRGSCFFLRLPANGPEGVDKDRSRGNS